MPAPDIRVVRRAAVIAAMLTTTALVPMPAQAVSGGSAANPFEAPWAVRLTLIRPGYSSQRCSGEIAGRGLIMTAGHCLNINHGNCSAEVRPTIAFVRFSNGRSLRIVDHGTRFIRHPNYVCGGSGGNNFSTNDVAFLRFVRNVGLPAIPLASPAEIASFANQGVTVFAAGKYKDSLVGWTLPRWVRKSRDGGLFQMPSCPYPSDLCFDPRRSTILGGDSGGAFVGWRGGWKLLGPVSGYRSEDGRSVTVNVAASLADPTIRSWVDQQIAVGFP